MHPRRDARMWRLRCDLCLERMELIDLESVTGSHEQSDTGAAMGANLTRHVPANTGLSTVTGGDRIPTQASLTAMREVRFQDRCGQMECRGR